MRAVLVLSELHPDKTRLIEFGRYAAERRRARGLGKAETFDFLGFTHVCVRTRTGPFWVRWITISKRMRAKLREVKDQLGRRRHHPIPQQGRWLASVVRGAGSLRRAVGVSSTDGNASAVCTVWTIGTRCGLTRRWLAKMWSISSPRPLNLRVNGGVPSG